MTGWSDTQKLYQLKLHLDKTVRETFRMFSEVDRGNYTAAVAALWKRLDIEVLRGFEFHHKTQSRVHRAVRDRITEVRS